MPANVVAAKEVRPYGSWRSPLKVSSVTEAQVGLSGVGAAGDAVFWLESRPSEGGRSVVVRRSEGVTRDFLPRAANARTRVHEYGGGAWLALDSAKVVYSNFADQRLYACDSEGAVQPLTAASEDCAVRFADCSFDATRRLLYCVRETHAGSEVTNEVVSVALDVAGEDFKEPVVLARGRDFYAAPRVSPDGTALAFVSWDHPNMPWDATTLSTLALDAAGAGQGESVVVAGADGDTSVAQPCWSPRTNELHYLSDASGWYNIYRQSLGDAPPVNLTPVSCEFGGAAIGWSLGARGYDFDARGCVVASYGREGRGVLAVIEADGTTTEYSGNAHALPSALSSPRCGADGAVYFLAAPNDAPGACVEWRADSLKQCSQEVLACASAAQPLAAGFVSVPTLVEFATSDGMTAFAHYYAPTNADCRAPDGERPPLIVKAHGGPTACANTAFSNVIQFWTTRGFAVADVDYRGSSGYGRAYRRLLRRKWGVYDVDDCCAVANYLVAQGLADPKRLAIDGGSAGGYTTLGALAWKETFTAGCSMYGIGDLSVLAKDTHKFESRYLDSLIGLWPSEEAIYTERAPINSVDTLSCPVLLLQGAEDKIVPPNQAEQMHAALLAKGIPTALKIYAGEQHGFRKAENIQDALNSEFYFYSRIFKFAADDSLPGFPIDNLDN